MIPIAFPHFIPTFAFAFTILYHLSIFSAVRILTKEI